jgi:hypothetical protein
MAFVVGINFAIGLRVIGVAPGIRLQAMTRLYPFHWYCAVIILLSGIALLFAYPAKALTNPLFYFKLAALICGLLISRYFQRRLAQELPEPPDDRSIKLLGGLSLLLWVSTISLGRFLAYTHSVLLASRFY